MNKRFDSITESLKTYIPFQIANKISPLAFFQWGQRPRFEDQLKMEMLKKKAGKFTSELSSGFQSLTWRFC